jgi:hypothetical protein
VRRSCLFWSFGKKNGLKVPITLYDGKILDGRNRYKACLEVGGEPRYETYTGDDPLSEILSLNLHRRHSNESQRSMVAANIANLEWGHNARYAEGSIEPSAHTIDETAEMLNVSRSSVKRAKKVKNLGTPELIHAVESGNLNVSAAEVLITLPKAEQKAVVEQGKEAVSQKGGE